MLTECEWSDMVNFIAKNINFGDFLQKSQIKKTVIFPLGNSILKDHNIFLTNDYFLFYFRFGFYIKLSFKWVVTWLCSEKDSDFRGYYFRSRWSFQTMAGSRVVFWVVTKNMFFFFVILWYFCIVWMGCWTTQPKIGKSSPPYY